MSNKLLKKSGELVPQEIKRLSYRRSKEAESKLKQLLVVPGGGSKV